MPDNAKAKKKPLCFVIGPIGKDGSAERKHSDLLLNALIKHVLHQEEFGYSVKRADEDADPGMIGDRVVTDIIGAEIVVADLTDLNPNAFYELGIRHSTEKPTIHVARAGTILPFDNVAHRTIFVDLGDWHSIEHARSRLAESVRAIHTPGYRVSNPITQANASFKMRQSEDPRDRLFAEIQERLGSLEKAVERTEAPSEARPSSSLRRRAGHAKRERRVELLFTFMDEAKGMRDKGSTLADIQQILAEVARLYDDKITEITVDEEGLHVKYTDGDPATVLWPA